MATPISSLFGGLLAHFSPESANSTPDPSQGAIQTTPDDVVKQLNQKLNPSTASDWDPSNDYENADEARADGYKIPNTPMYHDQQGNDITDKVNAWRPMQSPTFYQDVFNQPAANAERQANMEWGMRGSQARQTDAINQGLLAQHFATAQSQQGKPFGQWSPQGGAASGLNFNPTTALAQDTATEGVRAGLPYQKAGVDVAQMNADRDAAISRQKETMVGSMLHNPEARAYYDSSSLARGTGLNNIDIGQLPTTLGIRQNEDATSLAKTGQTRADLPTILPTIASNDLGNMYASDRFAKLASAGSKTATTDASTAITTSAGKANSVNDQMEAEKQQAILAIAKAKAGQDLTPLETESMKHYLAAKQAEDDNSGRKAITAGLLNTPESSAYNDSQNLNVGNHKLGLEISQMPKTIAMRQAQDNIEYARLHQNESDLPYATNTLHNLARTADSDETRNNIMSIARSANTMTDADTMHRQSLYANREAEFPPPSPLFTSRVTDDGYEPAYKVPGALHTQANMGTGMFNSESAPISVTTKDGKTSILPPMKTSIPYGGTGSVNNLLNSLTVQQKEELKQLLNK